MEKARASRAFRSIRRICYAGLDSVSLREEVARRIAEVIPCDARTFATTDPETGLFTHNVADGLPESLGRAWVEHIYPFEVAGEILDMARTGTAVSTAPSGMVMDLLRLEGFGSYMRTVLSERKDPWGFSCLIRGSGSAGFTNREKGFMRRIAPHLTRGLRDAALTDRALRGEDPADHADSGAIGPGVVILDDRGRFVLRNEAAVVHLNDLEDIGTDGDHVPYAVAGVVAQLRLRLASDPTEGVALTSELQIHGRSGRWYSVRASQAEPDAAGSTHTIILIEPARPGETAMILTRLYGLTRREREVVARTAKGESTKEIAARLGISPYTVQEHLGRTYEKVGVRSRKALLAKLFFDGYAPGFAQAG